MAGSSSGLAYDLSAFDVAAPAQPARKAQPDLKVMKSPRRMVSILLAPKVLVGFVFVIVMVSLILVNQVRLNEITAEINELNGQLEILKSENVKLTSELESTLSLDAVREQAKNELGMQRLDRYQTEYVILHQEDNIELTEQSPSATLGETMKMQITAAIQRIQEYLVS